MNNALEEICNFLPLTDRIGTAGQPGREQFPAIRDSGYEAVINLAMPHSDKAVPDEPEIVRALGMEYLSIPVVWDAPQQGDLQCFFDAMEAWKDRKIFVHCAMNMRVSAFMFLYRTLRLNGSPMEAEREMRRIWVPNERWRDFIQTASQSANPEDRSQQQLQMIGYITRRLKAANLPHWLFGGWAVDFRLGRITRLHHDIDFLANQKDASAVRSLMAAEGFADCEDVDSQEWSIRCFKAGQIVEFTLVEVKDGRCYFMEWLFPEGILSDTEARMGELSCPVVSTASLIQMKEECLAQEGEKQSREKYQHDLDCFRACPSVKGESISDNDLHSSLIHTYSNDLLNTKGEEPG